MPHCLVQAVCVFPINGERVDSMATEQEATGQAPLDAANSVTTDTALDAFAEFAGAVGEAPGVGGLGPGFAGDGAAAPTLPPPPVGAAPVTEPPPISLGTAVTYSSGNFGSGVFYGFNNFILPYFLQTLNAPLLLNALLGSTRSFEGAVIQPLVGAWSDRTWSKRFGRRNIFVLRFVPICVLFLILAPFLAQWTGLGLPFGWSAGFTALALASLGIFLFTLTFNIFYDPYQALLADITPERQRGGVNGVFQALGATGQVGILVTAIVLSGFNGGNLPFTLLFILTGALLAISFIPTLRGVREPRDLPGVARQHRYTLRDYWAGLRSDPR